MSKQIVNPRRDEYIKYFTTLIDLALAGEPAVAHFCEGIALQLYLKGSELHWRRIDGRDSGRSKGGS